MFIIVLIYKHICWFVHISVDLYTYLLMCTHVCWCVHIRCVYTSTDVYTHLLFQFHLCLLLRFLKYFVGFGWIFKPVSINDYDQFVLYLVGMSFTVHMHVQFVQWVIHLNPLYMPLLTAFTYMYNSELHVLCKSHGLVFFFLASQQNLLTCSSKYCGHEIDTYSEIG